MRAQGHVRLPLPFFRFSWHLSSHLAAVRARAEKPRGGFRRRRAGRVAALASSEGRHQQPVVGHQGEQVVPYQR